MSETPSRTTPPAPLPERWRPPWSVSHSVVPFTDRAMSVLLAELRQGVKPAPVMVTIWPACTTWLAEVRLTSSTNVLPELPSGQLAVTGLRPSAPCGASTRTVKLPSPDKRAVTCGTGMPSQVTERLSTLAHCQKPTP